MDKYRRLVKVATKHYKKDNGFCTVIATAIAMGCSFGAARSRLFHLVGRRDGNGIQRNHHISAMEMMGYKMTLVTNQFQSKTLVTIQREMKKTTGTSQPSKTVFARIGHTTLSNQRGTRYSVSIR